MREVKRLASLGDGRAPMHRPLDPPVTTMGPSGRMSDARRCWPTSPDTAMTGTSHEDTAVQLDTRITMIRRPAWGDVIKRSLPGGRLILRRRTHRVTRAKDCHTPTIRAPTSPGPLSRPSTRPARCRDACHTRGAGQHRPPEGHGNSALRHTVGACTHGGVEHRPLHSGSPSPRAPVGRTRPAPVGARGRGCPWDQRRRAAAARHASGDPGRLSAELACRGHRHPIACVRL